MTFIKLKINLTAPVMTLLFAILLSSCLPTKKETQCGSNEAFNATRKECVPVIGSSSSNTVFISNKVPENSYTTTTTSSSIIHSIAVSDTYDYGYSVIWKIHYSNGLTTINDTTVGTNILSYGVNPAGLYGKGSYTIEAILFDQDGKNQLDSKTWSINIDGPAHPQLVNPIPASTAYSYASNLTTTPLSLDINNTGGVNGDYKWYVDGQNTASGSFTSATANIATTINPLVLGMGIHTVELQLFNNSNASDIYDTYLWTINILNPNLPSIASTAPDYLYAITMIDGLSMAANGYRDVNNVILSELCVTFDDYDKDAIAGSDVDVIFELNGANIGIGAEKAPIGTSNTFCVSGLLSRSLSNPDVAESKTIAAKVFKKSTNDLIEVRQWSVILRPENIRPIIQISNFTSASLSCITTNPISYTGCSLTQSVDVDNNGDYTNHVEDVNNIAKLAIELTFDPDIADPTTDFELIYEIKKSGGSYEDIDGTGVLTASNIDCTFDDSTLKPSDNPNHFYCNIKMDAFSSTSGPLAPGDYIVKAHIRDANAGLGYSLASKESNTVTWAIAVKEQQTSNTIQISSQSTAAPAAASGTDSWIELTGNSCTSTLTHVDGTTAGADENEYIVLHTYVRDVERDNFYLSVDMSNAITGGSTKTTVVPSTSITRVNGTEFYEVSNCIKIPEWAVSNTTSDIVSFDINITDNPDSDTPIPGCTLCQDSKSLLDHFSLLVKNNNPKPTFTDNTNVNLGLSGITVFAGFPFYIPAPTNNDASVYDGATITWQWQVNVNSGVWIDISNATTPALYWTPDADIAVGADVDIRLCLGDNGFGNAPDCSDPDSTKIFENIVAYPSTHIIEATDSVAASYLQASSGKEIASWYDQTNEKLYTAYASGSKVYVEKIAMGAGGELTTIHSISFDTEDTTMGNTAVVAKEISITGVDSKSVYISYLINQSATLIPYFRVRRIDIARDKLSFSYGGFYNSINTAISRLDDSGLTGTGMVFSSPGNGNVSINTNTIDTGDNFTITTANGDSIAYNVAVMCAACNNVQLADDLVDFINTHSDKEISEELHAVTDFNEFGGSTILVHIYGAKIEDYYDSDQITPILGQIMISGGEWLLPYAKTTTDLALGMAKGILPTIIEGDMNGLLVGHTPPIPSSTFNQEITNTIDSTGYIIIATKGSSGNLDIYELNSSLALTSSIFNLFNLSSFVEIEDISISVDSIVGADGVAVTDAIYVSAKSLDASSNTYLSLAVIEARLGNYIANESFLALTTATHLVENIDQVQVVADPENNGRAIIALTTNISNTNPNKAYLAGITHDLTNWVSDINFEASSNVNYNAPNLNINDTVNGEPIFVTPVFTLTKGFNVTAADWNSTTGSVTATTPTTKPTLFFGFHESDSGNEINIGMFNIEKEQISTTSTGVSGAFPANISN